MTDEELISSLKNIVQPYVQDQSAFEAINEQSDFLTDLQINSAHLIDIVLDIEDNFNITIENEELEKMITVGATMKLIQAKLK